MRSADMRKKEGHEVSEREGTEFFINSQSVINLFRIILCEKYANARTAGGIKEDCAVFGFGKHCQYRFIILFGGRCILRLPATDAAFDGP